MRKNPYDNIIFVSKPRCASTSIFNHLYDWDDSTHGGKPLYHCTALDMIKILGKNYWQQRKSIAVVRDPLKLVVSWYVHHKNHKDANVRSFYPSFSDWVSRGFKTHWDKGWSASQRTISPLKQKQWICQTGSNEILVTDVIKMESLNEYAFPGGQVSVSNSSSRHGTITVSEAEFRRVTYFLSEDYSFFDYDQVNHFSGGE